MTDIEAFSSAYRELLDEAERDGSVPENLSLEVTLHIYVLFILSSDSIL